MRNVSIKGSKVASNPHPVHGSVPTGSAQTYKSYGYMNPTNVYHAASYGSFSPYYQPDNAIQEGGHTPYSPQTNRSGSQKRSSDVDSGRFANVSLESLSNEIFPLCKDQHGCRYFQKKLEERNPKYLSLIFEETFMHVVELMTGK